MNNRRPVRATIGSDLVKILNTPCEAKALIDFIEEAIKAKVLLKDEKKLCDAILEQYETTSTVDLDLAGNTANLYFPNYRHAFKEEELLYECEKFITSRQLSDSIDKVKDGIRDSSSNRFTRENTAHFLNRYATIIKVEKNMDLNSFLSSFNQDSTDDIISSNNEFVDRCFKGGLKNGKVTTIIGAPSNPSKSLWSLNIAYNALTKNKNVLYLTLGADERELNKRLILRHSYNTKFETELTSDDEIDDVFDMKLVEEVCKDFYENLSSHLIVLDDNDLDISTVTSLQKLFVFAEHKFHEINNRGIDLIVVDDFTNMKLDDGKKLITNKNQIQTEYYSFFRNQSKNFLGTKRMLPIVVTNEFDRKYATYFEENDTFQRSMIPEVIESLSDNILVIRNENTYQVKVTIVKPIRSADGGYYLTSVKACFNNWYMGYNNEDKTLKARAGEKLSDDMKVEAIFGETNSTEQENTDSIKTNLEEDPFGDDSNWQSKQEELKQFMLGTNDKEENNHE